MARDSPRRLSAYGIRCTLETTPRLKRLAQFGAFVFADLCLGLPVFSGSRGGTGHRIFLLFRYVAYRISRKSGGILEAREGTAMQTVLIADDSAFIRTALYEFFQREPDFAVCGVAENGREAVEEARRLHPDLIILDMKMPVMTGLEAARLLKRVMPEVRLIMYSATNDKVIEKAARSVGISEIISKSQRVSVLIDAARGVVHHKAA